MRAAQLILKFGECSWRDVNPSPSFVWRTLESCKPQTLAADKSITQLTYAIAALLLIERCVTTASVLIYINAFGSTYLMSAGLLNTYRDARAQA